MRGGTLGFHLGRCPEPQPVHHRIENVATHVAGDARAEIPPAAPVEGVIGLVYPGPLRRGAEPLIPMHRRRRIAAGRGAIKALFPIGAGAVGPGMDLADLADDLVLAQGVDRDLEALGRVVLDAHLGDHSRLLRDPGEDAGLVDRVRERLLRVTMQPQPHRRGRDRRVGVVGCCHHQAVDTPLLEQLAPVGVGLRRGELRLRLRKTILVDVADRDDLVARGELHHVAPALAPNADAGDREPLVGIGGGEDRGTGGGSDERGLEKRAAGP